MGANIFNIFQESFCSETIRRFETQAAVHATFIAELIKRYGSDAFWVIGSAMTSGISADELEEGRIRFTKCFGSTLTLGHYGRVKISWSDGLIESLDFRRWYFQVLRGTQMISIHYING